MTDVGQRWTEKRHWMEMERQKERKSELMFSLLQILHIGQLHTLTTLTSTQFTMLFIYLQTNTLCILLKSIISMKHEAWGSAGSVGGWASTSWLNDLLGFSCSWPAHRGQQLPVKNKPICQSASAMFHERGAVKLLPSAHILCKSGFEWRHLRVGQIPLDQSRKHLF